MDDLVQFLLDRLAEDERIARAAADELDGLSLGSEWRYDGQYVETIRERTMVAVGSQDFMELGTGTHIAAHDPARVLREIDSKRQLLERYERAMENRRAHPDDLASAGALLALHGAVKVLALPYADRPGYREDWRP